MSDIHTKHEDDRPYPADASDRMDETMFTRADLVKEIENLRDAYVDECCKRMDAEHDRELVEYKYLHQGEDLDAARHDLQQLAEAVEAYLAWTEGDGSDSVGATLCGNLREKLGVIRNSSLTS